MFSPRPGCFHVKLPGGIGNQLFALYASRYLSQTLGYSNHLDFGGVDYSHNITPYDIRTFQLPLEEIVFCNRRKEDTNVVSKVLINTILARPILGLHRFPVNKDSLIYIEDYIELKGLSGGILHRPTISDSYFADFSFFDSILDPSLKALELTEPSSSFLVTQQEISDSRVLGVHLRLGDYMDNLETIGVLSDLYFLNSITYALAVEPFDQIWIFSDTPNTARQRVSTWDLEIPIRIIDKSISNPVEQLVLLSKCHGVVCSNSTFSFWSAKFASESNPNNLVVVPRHFRKDQETLVSGLPKSWHLVENEWLSL
jgi:hypothetical protein